MLYKTCPNIIYHKNNENMEVIKVKERSPEPSFRANSHRSNQNRYDVPQLEPIRNVEIVNPSPKDLNPSLYAPNLEDYKAPENYPRKKKKKQDDNTMINTSMHDTSLNLNTSQMYLMGAGNSVLPRTVFVESTHNTYSPGRLPYKMGTNDFIDNSIDIGPEIGPSSNKRGPRSSKLVPEKAAGIKKEKDLSKLYTTELSGLEKLDLLSSIFVKQKFEMLEMLTGCETENRYKVYAADQGHDKVGRPIFKCKEKSSFMARNCLSGDCRPFQMRILHEEKEDDDEDMILFLDRACRCTICCMNRPEITVMLKEGRENRELGKVVSDWAFCDMLFTVFDATGQPIYKIYGDSCQWGLYCNCPCQACMKIVFQVQLPTGESVGEIYKIYSGTVKEVLTDTDNFCCVFPEGCPPEHKAILLATVLFIDFRYFEQSPVQNNDLV